MGRGVRRLLGGNPPAVLGAVLALLVGLCGIQVAPVATGLAAAMVAGCWWGAGPAVAATALASIGIECWLFAPARLGADDVGRDVLRHGILLVGGLVAALQAEVLRRARARADLSAGEANEHHRRLLESESRLRAFLDHVGAIAWLKDREGRYLADNSRFRDLLGLDEGRALGRRDAELGRPEVAAALEQGDRHVLEAGESLEREQSLAIGGATRTFLVTKFPLRDPSGVLIGVGGLALEITERKRLEDALRRSEARFRTLVDSNLLGIVTGDPDGTIRQANDAFLALVGRDRADLVAGRLRWSDLTTPGDLSRDDRGRAERIAGRACEVHEEVLIHKDGRRVPVLVGGAWHGGLRDCVGFVLDLSLRRRAEAELLRAREAAEAAGRAKDRFLAVLSHELRTPLTPVLVALTALLDGILPAALARPALEMIRRNVERESRLVDDLLAVSQATRDGLHLETRPLDLHELLRRAVDLARPDSDRARLGVALDLTAPVHHVSGDPERLLQLVGNLLDNAAKFSPEGGRLAIRSRNEPGPEAGTDAVRLVVEFEDTGPGLSPEELARIFEPFEQGLARPRPREGLGLGLAIGRAITEAHGGSLTAESRGPGLGTLFRLRLDAIASPLDPRPAPAVPVPSRPLRILLVEDNADTLRYLTLVLRRLGHDVHPVSTLADARSAVERLEPFELILSDIELPDGTGLDLLRHLDAPVPAIALSGFGSDEDIRLSLDAGFLLHLTKPINTSRLEEAIRQVLATAPSTSQPARGPDRASRPSAAR